MAITTTTNTKILTPFQAERVLLISKLRELVASGHSPLAIGGNFSSVLFNL
jgi:hypothetical protein